MLDHSVLQSVDLVIIAAYLVAMLWVGFHFMKQVDDTNDYYVAGRTLGPLVLMATVCATIIGGSGLMGRAGVAYSDGVKAIITAVPYLAGMFFFSAISGRISAVGTKHNIESMPDLFDRRFGKTAKLILSFMIAFAMVGTVASQVTATATILQMLGNGIGISYKMGAFIATAVFIVYTASAGLFGVVYTDVFQFYILLIFVYILLPISSLRYVGGWDHFVQNLDPALTQPKMSGSIVGDIITYFSFTLAGAEMWQRAFAAKDQKSAKRGMFWGTFVYGLTIILVYFMGVIGHQIIGDAALAEYGSTDAVVPALAIKVLPAGATGIALAGLLAVMMSSADSYLLISIQTCVHDIGETISPDMGEDKELKLSRLFAVILALVALVIALYINNAYNVLMFAWTFYAASSGIPALAALYWKKATKQGIIASMLGGFITCLVWTVAGLPFGIGAALPGIIVCTALLLIVSLATYEKNPAEFLDV